MVRHGGERCEGEGCAVREQGAGGRLRTVMTVVVREVMGGEGEARRREWCARKELGI